MITATTPSTPAITTEIADLMDDLTGFHPSLDRLIEAFGDLMNADLTADQAQSIVAALGGYDANVATLFGLTLRQISNPDASAVLAALPADRKQRLRRLGSEYAAEIDNCHLRQIASESSAAIEGV